MDYEQLHSDITKLLVKTQKEMEKLIEEYNENNDNFVFPARAGVQR